MTQSTPGVRASILDMLAPGSICQTPMVGPPRVRACRSLLAWSILQAGAVVEDLRTPDRERAVDTRVADRRLAAWHVAASVLRLVSIVDLGPRAKSQWLNGRYFVVSDENSSRPRLLTRTQMRTEADGTATYAKYVRLGELSMQLRCRVWRPIPPHFRGFWSWWGTALPDLPQREIPFTPASGTCCSVWQSELRIRLSLEICNSHIRESQSVLMLYEWKIRNV